MHVLAIFGFDTSIIIIILNLKDVWFHQNLGHFFKDSRELNQLKPLFLFRCKLYFSERFKLPSIFLGTFIW